MTDQAAALEAIRRQYEPCPNGPNCDLHPIRVPGDMSHVALMDEPVVKADLSLNQVVFVAETIMASGLDHEWVLPAGHRVVWDLMQRKSWNKPDRIGVSLDRTDGRDPKAGSWKKQLRGLVVSVPLANVTLPTDGSL